MPKQKREDLRRSCDILVKNLRHALWQAEKLYDTYYPDYPSYFPFPDVWRNAIVQLIASVRNFREMI